MYTCSYLWFDNQEVYEDETEEYLTVFTQIEKLVPNFKFLFFKLQNVLLNYFKIKEF